MQTLSKVQNNSNIITKQYLQSICLSSPVNQSIRAGRYGGIIVILRYVNSPLLILKVILLYDFIMIDIIANNCGNNSGIITS